MRRKARQDNESDSHMDIRLGLVAAPRGGILMTDGGRFEAQFLGVEKGKDGMASPAFEGVRYISQKGLRQLRLSAQSPKRRVIRHACVFETAMSWPPLNELNADAMQILGLPASYLFLATIWLGWCRAGRGWFTMGRSLRGWGGLDGRGLGRGRGGRRRCGDH